MPDQIAMAVKENRMYMKAFSRYTLFHSITRVPSFPGTLPVTTLMRSGLQNK